MYAHFQGRFSYEHLSSTCKTTLPIPSLQVNELRVSLGAWLIFRWLSTAIIWNYFICCMSTILGLISSSLVIFHFRIALHFIWIPWLCHCLICPYKNSIPCFSESQPLDLCQWTTTVAIKSCGSMRGYCCCLFWDIYCEIQSADRVI